MHKYKTILANITLSTLCICFISCSTSPSVQHHPINAKAQLGMVYLQQTHFSAARTILYEAVHEQPKIPANWYTLAYLEETTGAEKRAKQYYQHAITLAPQSGAGHNNYGAFLCRHGQSKASIREFLTAAKLPAYPSPGIAYENAGICAMQSHRYQAATTYFQQALRAAPNRSSPLLHLTDISIKQQAWDKAKTYLTQFDQYNKPNELSTHLHKILQEK